jgi:hypothetical protein
MGFFLGFFKVLFTTFSFIFFWHFVEQTILALQHEQRRV